MEPKPFAPFMTSSLLSGWAGTPSVRPAPLPPSSCAVQRRRASRPPRGQRLGPPSSSPRAGRSCGLAPAHYTALRHILSIWWITSLIQVICNLGAASHPSLEPCLYALRAVPDDAFGEMPDERQVGPAAQPVLRHGETRHRLLDGQKLIPLPV